MSSLKFTQSEQAEARAELREMLKPGDTVEVIQRHVSRSGMMRHLSLVIARDDSIINITRLAAAAMGERLYTDNGRYLKVGGAGMNMHFATVYGLSRALWPDGHKCTGKYGCPSNDHSNDYGTARSMFDKVLAERGEERLYGNDEAGAAQHEEFRAFHAEAMAKGPLGYRKSRKHSDGGYALNYATL